MKTMAPANHVMMRKGAHIRRAARRRCKAKPTLRAGRVIGVRDVIAVPSGCLRDKLFTFQSRRIEAASRGNSDLKIII